MDAFRHARESGIFSGDLFEYDSRYLCQENQGNKIKIMSPLLACFFGAGYVKYGFLII